MKLTRRKFLISTAAIAGLQGFAQSAVARQPEDNQAWKDIRQFLFGDKEIQDGSDIISLVAPERPPNGGDVTIKLLSSYPQNQEQFISKHYLVVDKNPSPIAARFTLSPRTAANIATRIRINEYSNVRAIAETNDGKLYMVKQFVKASGGCSAPPMGDDSMLKLMMGKTRLTQKNSPSDQLRELQLAVTHPSYSGLQKDQITTYFIPAHYVADIEVKNKDQESIFVVKGDISFSENPSFDFAYRPKSADDVLSVSITDSRKKVYRSQWPLVIS